jgi:signal-transduction protein with cAMP-binding, CBS, and nucleotidyltransferase domain
MTMTVKDIMHGITLVEPDASILEVARIMRDKNIGSVLIKVDPLHWGIVTERDIIIKIVARDVDPKATKASEIMTELRYTIDASASTQKASEIFNIHPIRRLPVMEDGEIIGMVTARDVAKYCIFKAMKTKREYGRGAAEGTRR